MSSDTMHKNRAMDWILLFALVVLWGSSFVLTRVAVAEVSPAWVVTGRLMLATLVLGVIVTILRLKLPTEKNIWLMYAALALVGNFLPFFLIATGQQYIDSGLAGVLMAIMPLATLMLAHFFVAGERMTMRKFSGFALGFVGILVLTGPNALSQFGGDLTQLLAQLTMLCAALCYAGNTIIARKMPAQNPLVNTVCVLFLAMLMSLPYALISAPMPFFTISITALSAVVALGVFSTLLATIVFFRLIALAGPTFLSQINYLIPLWALFVGMGVLGEQPEWYVYLALVLILAGLAFAQYTPKSHETASGKA